MAGLLCLTFTGNAWAPCNLTNTAGGTLTFGTWVKPTSGSNTADVTTADVRSGTGTFLTGTPVHGTFTMTNNGGGNCSGTLTITLTDTGGATGVTLSNFHLNYNGSAITNGQSGLVLPGTGGKTLLVGATATFTTAVTTGAAQTPTFNVNMLESGHSATNNTTGNSSITFDVPITITKVSDINFGTCKTASSVYTMSTAGSISATGSGAYISGTTSAGNLTIGGSTTSTVTLSVGNYQANGGPTPSNAKGAYNGGAAASFPMTVAAPGAGKTLLLGVDLTTTGSEATGTTFSPSFDVTAVYP
ncbi:MAG: hypothetical protein EPN97_16190 [Alphaproteobacteria bacterium]|nr:MAG: hypothetical protein EPN97_16190 [Alphaproteobacteria bacterium]